jgi:16S rRNA (cytosine967-C5)-methyltransferase
MKVSPARSAAFDILLRIERDRAFSSVLLPQYEDRLDQKDRGLCHEIVLGALRHQIELDRLIDALTSNKKIDAEIRIALRVGLFQLRYLDRVPAHAAINESVELAVRAKKRSAKGFVNGVLRSYLRAEPEILFAADLDRISVQTSHPRWLVERWSQFWGVERAAGIAESNNSQAVVDFRVLDPSLTRAEWSPAKFADGALQADRLDDSLRGLMLEGRIYIQDEASQLVASAVLVPENGSFLDVCAAPGGKTGLIARRFPGARVAAGDVHLSRVEHLRANLGGQSVDSAAVLRYDAEKGLPFADESFDAVLVDAPCSGTGTIRHNPEIRYTLTPEDLVALPRKQQQILLNASKTVRRGGLLVYSTCSLETEENEQVAGSFVAANPEFAFERPNIPERFITAEGFARTWPDRDGIDGFFVAAFRRS